MISWNSGSFFCFFFRWVSWCKYSQEGCLPFLWVGCMLRPLPSWRTWVMHRAISTSKGPSSANWLPRYIPGLIRLMSTGCVIRGSSRILASQLRWKSAVEIERRASLHIQCTNIKCFFTTISSLFNSTQVYVRSWEPKKNVHEFVITIEANCQLLSGLSVLLILDVLSVVWNLPDIYVWQNV
jgi:hypothetical protein